MSSAVHLRAEDDEVSPSRDSGESAVDDRPSEPPLDASPLDVSPLDAPLLDVSPLDAPLLDAPPESDEHDLPGEPTRQWTLGQAEVRALFDGATATENHVDVSGLELDDTPTRAAPYPSPPQTDPYCDLDEIPTRAVMIPLLRERALLRQLGEDEESRDTMEVPPLRVLTKLGEPVLPMLPELRDARVLPPVRDMLPLPPEAQLPKSASSPRPPPLPRDSGLPDAGLFAPISIETRRPVPYALSEGVTTPPATRADRRSEPSVIADLALLTPDPIDFAARAKAKLEARAKSSSGETLLPEPMAVETSERGGSERSAGESSLVVAIELVEGEPVEAKPPPVLSALDAPAANELEADPDETPRPTPIKSMIVPASARRSWFARLMHFLARALRANG